MSENHADIITVSVRDFMRRTGISRSQTYVLLDEGLLQSVKVKGSRLIMWNSVERLLARSQVPPRLKPPAATA
jgi:predicted DNA-binding transcriptional regulator AlpA